MYRKLKWLQAFHFKRLCLYSGIFCSVCKGEMQVCLLNSNLSLSEVVLVRPEVGGFAIGPDNSVVNISEQRLKISIASLCKLVGEKVYRACVTTYKDDNRHVNDMFTFA